MKKLLLVLFLISVITMAVFGLTGTYTSNGYFYLPGYGAYGTDEFAAYNAAMEAADNAIKDNATTTGNEYIQDVVGAMFTDNTETFITNTYQDADGTVDSVVPVKDEDNMTSDSGTFLCTQQSIKAYADTLHALQYLKTDIDSKSEVEAIWSLTLPDLTGTPVQYDFARFTDADTIEGRSYAEMKSDLGLVIGTDVLAEQTIGIANDNLIEMDDADAAAADYCKLTANGIVGRSYTEVKTDLSLNYVENLKVKLDGTQAPTVNNDTDEGYVVGSRWVDVTNDKEYVCLDNTDGAAVWTETTGAGGGAGTYLELTDTPAAYTDQAGKYVKVNVGEDALEFGTPAGAGDVVKIGTPANSQVGVWTGDGTIEGAASLTYDGSNLLLTGDIGKTDGKITKGWFTDLLVTNAIAGSITGNAATVTSFTPTGGSLILAGADALTLTTTAATNVTLPTTGTLMANLVEDTDPDLGGEMDAGAHSIGFTLQTDTGTGAKTIDWKLGNKMKFTFGAGNVAFTFTAPTNPCTLMLTLIQDGTGSRTITWPATVKWAGGTEGVLTTTANARDKVALDWDGSQYDAVISKDFK